MVKLKNICKSYGDFRLDASMEIPEGCITGLVGKNGAGKSTVIKLILGLTKADDGQIMLFGKEIEKLPVADKTGIGASLAESGFSTQLNLLDVKKILRKMYPEFQQSYFEQKCRELHLPEKKRIREYSTGMKAKLKILVAMTHQAKLLVLDVNWCNKIAWMWKHEM